MNDKDIKALLATNEIQLKRLVHYDMVMTHLRGTLASAMTDTEKVTAISLLLSKK